MSNTPNLPPVLTGEQALDSQLRVEVIAAYPYCSNVRINDSNELESFPSVLTEMVTRAATLLQAEHPGSRIALPGESPFIKEGLTNTTDHMADIALKAGVAESALIRMYHLRNGRGLNNTYLQSRGLYERFNGRSDGMLTLPLRYHQPRVQRSQAAFGMTPNFTTAESIFQEAGIRDYDEYFPLIDGLQGGEQKAQRLTDGIHLPKGQLVNFLMRLPIIGSPRIVDVQRTPDGELELEDTTAGKKIAQLKKQIQLNAALHTEAA